MQIFTWNINGLATGGEAALGLLADYQPDILCLQETKLPPQQISLALRHPPGYHSYWAPAALADYSGLAIYSRQVPRQVGVGLGQARFDAEGRVLLAKYEGFSVLNVYAPSGAEGRSQWYYKMAFLHQVLDYALALRAEGEGLILCGDFSIAHQNIDLARPLRVAGFMAEERDWISELLDSGFVDAYRHLHPEQTGAYTWWSPRGEARAANQGWRMDYLFISADLTPTLSLASLHPDISGSDHCPASVLLNI